MIEALGITGTAVIVLAFTLSGERKVRAMDTVGAALFVVYGILTQTWSTAILNFFLICINCYKIFKRG